LTEASISISMKIGSGPPWIAKSKLTESDKR
jgi:hypothetical protein